MDEDESFDDIVADVDLPYGDEPVAVADEAPEIAVAAPSGTTDPQTSTGTEDASETPAESADALAQALAREQALQAQLDRIEANAQAANAEQDRLKAEQDAATRARAAQMENQFVTGYSKRLRENGLDQEADQFLGFAGALRKRTAAAELKSEQQQIGMESWIAATQLLAVGDEQVAGILDLAERMAEIADPAMREAYGQQYVKQKLLAEQTDVSTKRKIAELEEENRRLKGGEIDPATYLVDSGIASRSTGKTWEEMDFDDIVDEAAEGF